MPYGSKRVFKTIGKIVLLCFPLVLIAVQAPELRYDLASRGPVEITSADQLDAGRLGRLTFASVIGAGNFEQAFVYRSHGVSYAYFPVEPYGPRLIVRTHQKVTDEWRDFDRFVGKLSPIQAIPFKRSVRTVFHDRFGVEIPDDAFVLAHEDVPALSGWNVAAVCFAALLLAAMVYVFFIRRPRAKSGLTPPPWSLPS